MNPDLSFRLALVLIATVQLTLSRVLVRRAGAGATLLQSRAEGPWLAAGTATFLLAYGGAVALRMVYPSAMDWAALPLPSLLRWCGAPLMAAGALLHLWGTCHLGANLTLSISTRPDHQLVTSGPFGWVRHPLYLGGTVESLGVALLLANGAVAFAALGFWGLVALRTSKEDAILLATFGDDYFAYRARVPAWLPRPCLRQRNR